MNTQKKIEQSLKSAPKPAAPDGLLNRLQEDVAAGEIKKRVTVIRRWFAPTGERISLRRVTAAAAIAIAVLLPLSYGATKTVKRIIKTFEAKFVYPQDDGGVHGYGVGRMGGVGVGIGSSDPNFTEEDAQKAEQEFDEIDELRKAGKYERTFIKEVEKNGVKIRLYEDRFTLSNGKVITMGAGYGRNSEMLGLSEAERKELLKKQFDEIDELRKAGKFERTFIKEIEIDGVMHNLYEDSFTLSNGKVIKMGAGEPVKNEDNQ